MVILLLTVCQTVFGARYDSTDAGVDIEQLFGLIGGLDLRRALKLPPTSTVHAAQTRQRRIKGRHKHCHHILRRPDLPRSSKEISAPAKERKEGAFTMANMFVRIFSLAIVWTSFPVLASYSCTIPDPNKTPTSVPPLHLFRVLLSKSKKSRNTRRYLETAIVLTKSLLEAGTTAIVAIACLSSVSPFLRRTIPNTCMVDSKPSNAKTAEPEIATKS